MNNDERIQLDKLIKGYQSVDTTDKIRSLKHSEKIKQDINQYQIISKKYERLRKSNPNQFEQIMVKHCNFLFTNYTIIFNKLKKNFLNLSLLYKFIDELKNIEDGKCDQHEASVNVGKILKEIYIDSALTEDSIRNKTSKPNFLKPIKKNFTWKQYKLMNEEI